MLPPDQQTRVALDCEDVEPDRRERERHDPDQMANQAVNAGRGSHGKPAGPPVNSVSACNALASVQYILRFVGVLFVAATALCGWLLVTSADSILVVFGSAALTGVVGTGLAIRAARMGLGGLSDGATGAPPVARARALARTATTVLAFGASVPVEIALAMMLSNHGDATRLILSVIGALVLGMWSMTVDTSRNLLDRASGGPPIEPCQAGGGR